MTDSVIRSYDATIDSVDAPKRTMVAKINTDGLDRFRTVISPKGGKLEAYRKNPVVLWEHGKDPRRYTDPIGTNEWITERGGALLAKTRFLTDDFSQQRFEWYRDGVLNAVSVHAIPQEGSPPTKDELRSRPDWEGATMIYRAWELAEYSGTAVPGNADTLTTERARSLIQRGVWLPDDVRSLIEAKAGPIEPEPESEGINRFIRKKPNGKYGVYSESGKELGEHDSEEGAKKQLAAVEAHKHDERAWIDDQGSVLIVRNPDGSSVLSTSDRVVAEECIRAMTTRQTFERLHMDLVQEIRGYRAEQARFYQDFKEDIAAYLDLTIRGVV